jgi:hypothetical protein
MNPHWYDLAAKWQDLYKPAGQAPADPRKIVLGLAAAQDDAIKEQFRWDCICSLEPFHPAGFAHVFVVQAM